MLDVEGALLGLSLDTNDGESDGIIDFITEGSNDMVGANEGALLKDGTKDNDGLDVGSLEPLVIIIRGVSHCIERVRERDPCENPGVEHTSGQSASL